MSHNPIQCASLTWNEQGTPVSAHFDDVYFSNQDGLEETRYVFLNGNGIPERFHSHNSPRFTVAETGFGTGLNFLTLWQAFDVFCQQQPEATLQRLHFISFEKYPLQVSDLAAAHARWPELATYAAELREQWPLPVRGCQRLILADGRVILDLWLGDVNELLHDLDSSLHGQIDAWFLDGFAPAKNPDMWTDNLFHTMAQFAHPQGRIATFTSAGFVRRGLQAAGFIMQKRKGFGRKREMLTGQLREPITTTPVEPGYQRTATDALDDVAIIGGGIAGALLALSLQRRGAKVTLYCADKHAAQGASGNRQGALYPLLNGRDDELEQFFTQAFGFARRQYDLLLQQGISFDHQWCGVTQLAYNARSEQKIAQLLNGHWPANLVQTHSAATLSANCGVEIPFRGVTYPLGGWLCPAQLTTALYQFAEQQGLTLHFNNVVTQLEAPTEEHAGWRLTLNHSRTVTHRCVVLANGHQLPDFTQSAALPVTAVRGQVSHIPSSGELTQLRQVLCYDGYLTPVNLRDNKHCIGASHVRDDRSVIYRETEQQENKVRLQQSLPNIHWPDDVNVNDSEARCGVRCVIRDHLPLVGNLPDYAATLQHYPPLKMGEQAAERWSQDSTYYPNLFVLGALGARGLCTAPLCAEVLAAQMCGEPLPLSRQVLAAINPNRMWIRQLRKGKTPIAFPVDVNASNASEN